MKVKMIQPEDGCFDLCIPGRESKGDKVDSLATLSLRRYDGFCWIAGLYVPKALRRQGMARHLVAGALMVSQDRFGRSPVYLDCLPFADRPVPQAALFTFYHTLGFMRVPGHPYSMRFTGGRG